MTPAVRAICAIGGTVSNLDASYFGYGAGLSTPPLNITPNCRNTIFTGIAVHNSMGMLDTNNTGNNRNSGSGGRRRYRYDRLVLHGAHRNNLRPFD